jgi:hypothetical protein
VSDELGLLREANPVSGDEGPFRDRPLDAAAEHRLARLRDGSRTPDSRTPDSRTRDSRTRGTDRFRLRARHSVLAGAAAALAAVLLVVIPTGGNPAVAVAAPRPLVVERNTAPLPLAEVARRARLAQARNGTTAARMGSHYQSWSIGLWSGGDAPPPITVPEERLTRWNADGSRTDIVVATDPSHPGEPVIVGDDNRTVSDGTVLQNTTDLPGALGTTTFVDPPPHDPAGLRRYLLTTLGAPGVGTSTTALLEDLRGFLYDWTPGTRENAALASVLAKTSGVRPAGAVVDRLGRHGQAYTYTPPGPGNAIRYLLILDPDTGAVLGIETVYTRAVGEYKIKAGDVLSYEAWIY